MNPKYVFSEHNPLSQAPPPTDMVRVYMSLRRLDAYDVKTNDNAFVLWWHDLKESTLYVSRARFPDSGDNVAATTRVLLNAALQEARKFKLKKVVVWDPPSGL
ncbi:hypothetical protein L917_05869, partial [Phytophthora nicotianae]